jgi:hypothetical protein
MLLFLSAGFARNPIADCGGLWAGMTSLAKLES